MYVKTNLKIGKFFENSRVDNVPIVYVTKKELENIPAHEYVKMDFNYSEIIENFSKYVPIKKHDSENFEICFVDMNSINLESGAIETFVKKFNMSDGDLLSIADDLVEKIIELSNQNSEMSDKFSMVDVLKNYQGEELRRKFIAKLHNASLYIATNGRIGQGNTILVSKENYEKYNMSEFTENYEILLMNVDDIYVYRKNSIDQPGLILTYFIDDDDIKYKLVGIGFNPEKQFQKITLK